MEAGYLFVEVGYLFVEVGYLFVEAGYLFVEAASTTVSGSNGEECPIFYSWRIGKMGKRAKHVASAFIERGRKK